jgi:hypothetical protein
MTIRGMGRPQNAWQQITLRKLTLRFANLRSKTAERLSGEANGKKGTRQEQKQNKTGKSAPAHAAGHRPVRATSDE